MEEAGSKNFTSKQSELFGRGFSFSGYERDMLQLNRDGKSFFNISGTSGIDSISDGRGAVFADFDNDGDTDVFLTTIQGRGRLLFRNNVGGLGNWLRISLTGTRSGNDAYGAVVRIGIEDGVRTRLKAGGSGYNAQADPRLLFGLGDAKQADWVEITWPSGAKQKLKAVPANTSIAVTEGKDGYTVVKEKRFNLPDPLSREATQLSKLHAKKGAPLPDFTLHGKQVKPVKALLQKGKVHLLNVWATWCVPCAREMPELQALQAEHGDKLQVIGMSVDEAALDRKVSMLLKRRRITYPNYRMDQKAVEALYNSKDVFVPLSVVVDDAGKVLDIFPGWNQEAKARLLKLLK